MKAFLALRTKIRPRWDAFIAGFVACGIEVISIPSERISQLLTLDRRDSIFVTWNRIGVAHQVAREYEHAGLPVLVVENPSWGKLVKGHWLQLQSSLHNTRDRAPYGGPSRWDALDIDLAPMRDMDGETVVLAQRSIGNAPVAQPRGWHEAQRNRGRVRAHPNDGHTHVPDLAVDLRNASRVVHWASAAGVEALAMGIPSDNGYEDWIGASDGTKEGRVETLRRMAWSQWTLDEIAEGTPIRRMLA